MTDSTMKELVLKHEQTIESLVKSVDALVNSNSETNIRLKEISEHLYKQAVFDTKLSSLDKELTDSFKGIYSRIDELEITQNSNAGCKSVQLLSKDVKAHDKDITQLVGGLEDTKLTINNVDKSIEALPSRALITWGIGILVIYSISFGSYVVSSLHKNDIQITKLIENVINEHNINKINH